MARSVQTATARRMIRTIRKMVYWRMGCICDIGSWQSATAQMARRETIMLTLVDIRDDQRTLTLPREPQLFHAIIHKRKTIWFLILGRSIRETKAIVAIVKEVGH